MYAYNKECEAQKLRELCERLIAELREWNPDSEAANEAEQELKQIVSVEGAKDEHEVKGGERDVVL